MDGRSEEERAKLARARWLLAFNRIRYILRTITNWSGEHIKFEKIDDSPLRQVSMALESAHTTRRRHTLLNPKRNVMDRAIRAVHKQEATVYRPRRPSTLNERSASEGARGHIGFEFKKVLSAELKQQCIEVLSKPAASRDKDDVDKLLELVKGDQFFEDLLPTLRSEMCRVMRYKKLPVGATVFKQGDPGFSLYIIMSGAVRVVISNMGIDIEVAEIYEGESFGELALASSQPRSATIETIQECELLIIDNTEYQDLLTRMREKDTADKLKVLERMQLVRDWSHEQHLALTKTALIRRFPCNKVIAQQGEECDCFYAIKIGECRVLKRVSHPSGQNCIVELEHLHTMDFFGEGSLFPGDAVGGTQHKASLVSKDFVEVVIFSASTMLEVATQEQLGALKQYAQRRERMYSGEAVSEGMRQYEKWVSYKQSTLPDSVRRAQQQQQRQRLLLMQQKQLRRRRHHGRRQRPQNQTAAAAASGGSHSSAVHGRRKRGGAAGQRNDDAEGALAAERRESSSPRVDARSPIPPATKSKSSPRHGKRHLRRQRRSSKDDRIMTAVPSAALEGAVQSASERSALAQRTTKFTLARATLVKNPTVVRKLAAMTGGSAERKKSMNTAQRDHRAAVASEVFRLPRADA